MEHKYSLTCSRQRATCSYPELDDFSPHPAILSP